MLGSIGGSCLLAPFLLLFAGLFLMRAIPLSESRFLGASVSDAGSQSYRICGHFVRSCPQLLALNSNSSSGGAPVVLLDGTLLWLLPP